MPLAFIIMAIIDIIDPPNYSRVPGYCVASSQKFNDDCPITQDVLLGLKLLSRNVTTLQPND